MEQKNEFHRHLACVFALSFGCEIYNAKNKFFKLNNYKLNSAIIHKKG